MVRVVYIDLLFLFNLAADLLLLAVSGLWAGLDLRLRRLLPAACLGALGAVALALYDPPLPVLLPVGLLLLPVLMVWLAFRPPTCTALLRQLGCLYAVALLLGGGAVLALQQAAPTRPAAAAGVMLLGVGLALAGGRTLVRRARGGAARQASCRRVRLELDGRRADLPALVDTGHHLCHPLTGRPVLVAALAALRPLLPPDLAWALVGAKPGVAALEQVPAVWRSRVTWLPYASLGCPQGWMPAVRMDAAWLCDGDGGDGGDPCGPVWVGVAPGPLHPDGDYAVLVPPGLQRAQTPAGA